MGVQLFAWAKMSTQFLKHDAPRLALRKTFDDQHPCEICKHLQEMRAKQAAQHNTPAQRTSTSQELNVLAGVSAQAIQSAPQNFKLLFWQIIETAGPARADSPLTPPPKFFWTV